MHLCHAVVVHVKEKSIPLCAVVYYNYLEMVEGREWSESVCVCETNNKHRGNSE